MTPSRYYTLNQMQARLPVNYQIGINALHVAIRDEKGCLLRGFMVHYKQKPDGGIGEWFNADDFDKWLKFMGFSQ